MAQIILGVNNKNTQEKLLREELSLEKMVSHCNMVEMTERNLEMLSENKLSNYPQEVFACSKPKRVEPSKNNAEHADDGGGTNSSKFHKLEDPKPLNKVPCSKCGQIHEFRNCPAFGKRCFKCNLMNHFGKMCKIEWKKSYQVNNSSDLNNGEPSLSHLSLDPVQTKKELLKQ